MSLCCPRRSSAEFRMVDELHARRDNRVNTTIAALRALSWNEAPPALRDAAIHMLRAPHHSARALVRLAALWRQADWNQGGLDALDLVLAADLRDWRESSGLSLRLRRARLDFYRNAAKCIAGRFGLIAIEKLGVKAMAESDDDPTPPLLNSTESGRRRQSSLRSSYGQQRSRALRSTCTKAGVHGFAQSAGVNKNPRIRRSFMRRALIATLSGIRTPTPREIFSPPPSRALR